MKKIIVVVLLIGLAHTYIGYYETRWAEDNKYVFFIKKFPTLQTRFENIYDSDADDKTLKELGAEERRLVRDYCKYRLGIETWLQTEDELEVCKGR
jgi:hypothetical protein